MNEQPTQHEFDTGDVRLTYFEWGAGGAPTVLLVHATGFHARCWDRTVAALPAGYRVLAVDMRGHGRSDRKGPYVWEAFGRDLVALISGLGLSGVIGVGHSMGGHSVTQAAAALPDAFSRLVLLDPVILDPEAYATDRFRGFQLAEDHPVARRRNRWSSWQEMFQHFEHRHPFSLWRREVLEDYCRYGLLPSPDGSGYELACPPLVEASVYLGNSQTDIHAAIPSLGLPVVVVRAQMRDPVPSDGIDFSKSPTWPRLADEFPNARDVYLPALSHFIPMQEPELVAGLIVDPDAQVPAGAS